MWRCEIGKVRLLEREGKTSENNSRVARHGAKERGEIATIFGRISLADEDSDILFGEGVGVVGRDRIVEHVLRGDEMEVSSTRQAEGYWICSCDSPILG